MRLVKEERIEAELMQSVKLWNLPVSLLTYYQGWLKAHVGKVWVAGPHIKISAAHETALKPYYCGPQNLIQITVNKELRTQSCPLHLWGNNELLLSPKNCMSRQSTRTVPYNSFFPALTNAAKCVECC